MRYHDFPMHGDGGPHVFGFLLFVLLVALLVGLVVFFVGRWGAHRAVPPAAPTGQRAAEDPLEVLRLRYARGEVDRDAFLQASQDLGGAAPPG